MRRDNRKLENRGGKTGERTGEKAAERFGQKPEQKTGERFSRRGGERLGEKTEQRTEKKTYRKSANVKNSGFNNKSAIEKSAEKPEGCFIEGRNAVIEALLSERQVEKVLVTHDDAKIIALSKEKGVVVQKVPKSKLDEISETKNHQGAMAVIAAVAYAELEDILELAQKKDEPPFIVVLDHISDPYNLGAIIRTAEAAGAHGVVIPKRRAAGVTAIAEKASAGAASHIPIARVSNISACIEKLKEVGIWTYCAHTGGEPLYQQDLSGAAAIVIGSEGDGVSRLTMEKCDVSLSIPMLGKISSLNASVAAGVALYEVVRQRMK